MSTPKQHRLIGKVVADRYRIVELLGEGGMGAVYLAEHLTLHKQVALKVVHAEHAKNPELGERFSREAMATSRIEHPNVISAIDFGKLPDGTAYLAVQLVRGPSLSRVLTAEGPMPWPRAAHIASQIADALGAAHGHGIVHRDLKPDNVLLQFLDDGGELVKVLDFGVAKFSGTSAAKMGGRADVTQVGFIVGTPGYMAPEQAVGQPSDERADLYSLGVILWECLVGRQLWKAPDLQHLVERQLVEVAPRLSAVSPDTSIPPLLDDLVAALLARRAADRPPDAATVRDTLREVVRLAAEEPQRWRTGARPVPASLRNATPAGNVPAPQLPSGGAKPEAHHRNPLSSLPSLRVRHSKTAWIFAGLLLCILLGAAFLVVTGRVELRPRKDVAAVVNNVAEQLNLPGPTPGAQGRDESGQTEEADGPTATGLPRALDATYDKLLEAAAYEERSAAADTLLAHVPPEEIPLYVRRVARLHLARTCAEKRSEIEQLAEVKDPRSLPALIRLAQKPRYGCGKKKKEDCFGCLRDPLATLITALEGGGSASAPSSP